MKKLLKHPWIIILMASSVAGCVGDNSAQKKSAVQPSVSGQKSSPVIAKAVCPIPPIGYERIPGYQPDSADPSLAQKLIVFISPTLEGNPPFYLGILQQPLKFCGIAKDNIVKVKFFASGAYIYGKQMPIPAKPLLHLGEAPVENGIWFFAYNFREGKVRDIIAQGYDADNKLIATTNQITISLSGPDPR